MIDFSLVEALKWKLKLFHSMSPTSVQKFRDKIWPNALCVFMKTLDKTIQKFSHSCGVYTLAKWLFQRFGYAFCQDSYLNFKNKIHRFWENLKITKVKIWLIVNDNIFSFTFCTNCCFLLCSSFRKFDFLVVT